MKIALLKYSGGGDWYANLDTSLKNLVDFCNRNYRIHDTHTPGGRNAKKKTESFRSVSVTTWFSSDLW